MHTSIYRSLRILAVLAFVFFLNCGCDFEPKEPSSLKNSGPIAVLFNIDGSMPAFSNGAGLFPTLQMSQYRLTRLIEKSAADIQVQEVIVHIGSPEFSGGRRAISAC